MRASISGDQNISGKNISNTEHQDKGLAGFERLWVWQKAHKLMLEVHTICKILPK